MFKNEFLAILQMEILMKIFSVCIIYAEWSWIHLIFTDMHNLVLQWSQFIFSHLYMLFTHSYFILNLFCKKQKLSSVHWVFQNDRLFFDFYGIDSEISSWNFYKNIMFWKCQTTLLINFKVLVYGKPLLFRINLSFILVRIIDCCLISYNGLIALSRY